MTAMPPNFACEVRENDAAAVVCLRGELDMATVPEVDVCLRALACEKRQVTVDLRGLDFMDSTGLRLIIEIDALARQDGFNFSVVRGSPAVQRVMEISGVDAHLVLIDRPEDLHVPRH
jgi:anti-sigma B factor antagonist